DLADLVPVPVECHDAGAAPVALEGVPAGSTAEVQDTVAGGEREPGEVDGQHVALLSGWEVADSSVGVASGAPADAGAEPVAGAPAWAAAVRADLPAGRADPPEGAVRAARAAWPGGAASMASR